VDDGAMGIHGLSFRCDVDNILRPTQKFRRLTIHFYAIGRALYKALKPKADKTEGATAFD
jgi:hypothetical protein